MLWSWAGAGRIEAQPAAAPTPANNAPKPPTASEKAADKPAADAKAAKEKAAKEKATDKLDTLANEASVNSARPQLLAIRGGSLGFPTANNGGLLAGVDAKIVGGQGLSTASSVDAFAKVGGISIGLLAAEVIGESFEADVPVIALTGMPAVPGMVKTSFSAVGIRGRFVRVFKWTAVPVPDWKAPQRLTEGCKELARDTGSLSTSSADPSCQADLQEVDKLTNFTKEGYLSFMVGLRLVRRGGSNEGLTNLGGVQWEAGVRYDSDAKAEDRNSWSIMGGLAGMHLNQSDLVTDGVTTRFIRLNDLRLSLSAEYRKRATKDQAVTSAAGVYGTCSQDFWTNKFHVGGADKVRDYQLEGGVYISGAMNGFSGMIVLSVIKPYAHGAENLYAVSVIPFGGGEPGKGAR